MKLSAEQKERVEELLAQMTLEEKIGQMNLESPSIVGGFDVPFEELIEMMTDGRLSKERISEDSCPPHSVIIMKMISAPEWSGR